MAKYEYEGSAEERKTVGRQGKGCGIVYVPKTWIGKNVAVVLLAGKDAEG
jgi:putative transposon-encoded protein